MPGFKTVFVSDEGGSDGDPDDVTLFWHVEDFALSHYRSLGYDQGEVSTQLIRSVIKTESFPIRLLQYFPPLPFFPI